MTLPDLLDEYRRWAAEIIVGWALRMAPMKTEADHAFGRALAEALRGQLADVLRRGRIEALGDSNPPAMAEVIGHMLSAAA